MSTQLLIYEQATPVSRQRHGNWSVRSGTDFAFARNVNSVPLLAVEFPATATEYAIVFAGSGDSVVPVVMLGIRERENLYVDSVGGWAGQYVPAFIRRYPFVFASADDGSTFTLCIDEEFAGCNQDGAGERLFDAQGEQTQYLARVLEFLQAYEAHYRRTVAFCARLRELDLLEPMNAQFRLRSGETFALSGFSAVDRNRLKALDPAQLADLARSDELELIYLHLASMRNVTKAARRLGPQAVVEGAPEVAGEEGAPTAPTAPEAGEEGG